MRFPGNIDQARQGWGCVLGLHSPEREGSEGSGMKKQKVRRKDVAACGVWLLPDPHWSPGAGCVPNLSPSQGKGLGPQVSQSMAVACPQLGGAGVTSHMLPLSYGSSPASWWERGAASFPAAGEGVYQPNQGDRGETPAESPTGDVSFEVLSVSFMLL